MKTEYDRWQREGLLLLGAWLGGMALAGAVVWRAVL